MAPVLLCFPRAVPSRGTGSMSSRALLLAAVVGAAAALASACNPARPAPTAPAPPRQPPPAAEPAAPAEPAADPVVEETRRHEESVERPALPAPAGAAEIHFAPGAAELTPEARASLDRLIGELRAAAADFYLEVQGHSDASGSESGNWELARRRAEAVRDYLLEETGLPEDRIGILPLGSSLPAADNRTPGGRARNRRVVVLTLRPPGG